MNPEFLAVDEIIDDLRGRSGLGDAWDAIDEDIREDIKDGWTEEVTQRIEEAVSQREFCNIQLRQIQYDQENKTEGAIHVNLLTELWRFYNEEKDAPINGFAVDGVENLPPSVRARLSDDEIEWLDRGGNVYTQAEVQEFIDMVDQVDGVIHRFRDTDSVSFSNQDEDALQEALDQRKPEEDSEEEESEDDQE